MILKELFEQQKKLDERIIKEHYLEGKDLFKNTIVALLVELSECANEIRFFKHWSNKKPSSRDVILEEFVDVLHFALSIGNMLEEENLKEREYTPRHKSYSFAENFLNINRLAISLADTRNCIVYIGLIEELLDLAIKLGFTVKAIEMAYYKKNEINFKRQEQGY